MSTTWHVCTDKYKTANPPPPKKKTPPHNNNTLIRTTKTSRGNPYTRLQSQGPRSRKTWPIVVANLMHIACWVAYPLWLHQGQGHRNQHEHTGHPKVYRHAKCEWKGRKASGSQDQKSLARRASHKFSFCDDDFLNFKSGKKIEQCLLQEKRTGGVCN